MIANYKGVCVVCGKPTKAGVDIYEVAEKKNFHVACRPAKPPSTRSVDAEALADRLGYVEFDRAESVRWSEIRADRAVRELSGSDLDGPAEPVRGDDGSRGNERLLFGLSEEE